MAFVHGKNSVFFLRDVGNTWRDMTPYTTEITVPAKAGIAETTVFGRGAKTYIGGLLEGTLTVKGFWDPTATSGPDAVFSGLLGSQPNIGLSVVAQVLYASNYGQFIILPAGLGSSADSAHTCLIGDIVLTDYNVSDPVTNVVSFTATFQLSGAPIFSSAGVIANTGGSTNTGSTGLQVIRNTTANVLASTWQATAGQAGNVTGATYSNVSATMASNLGTK